MVFIFVYRLLLNHALLTQRTYRTRMWLQLTYYIIHAKKFRNQLRQISVCIDLFQFRAFTFYETTVGANNKSGFPIMVIKFYVSLEIGVVCF